MWRNWLNDNWQGKLNKSEKTRPSANLSITEMQFELLNLIVSQTDDHTVKVLLLNYIWAELIVIPTCYCGCGPRWTTAGMQVHVCVVCVLSVQYLWHPVSPGFCSNQLKPNFITKVMHFSISINMLLNLYLIVIFEFLIAMTMENFIFWYLMPFSLVEFY
jgi:hypothetical protein